MEKLGKWLLTDRGKSFSAALSLGVAAGGFLSYLIPQGLCIEQLKSIVQMYHQGSPKTLDPAVEARALEIVEKSELQEEEKRQFQFFTAYGLDMFSAGCIQTKWGAIIGIPDTFSYKTRNDVKRSSIKIRNTNEISWGSEEGIQFQKSLILTDKAQKYAIAREVQRSSLPHVYFYGGLTSLLITINFGMCRYINTYYKLYQKPRKLRVTLYTLMSSFTAVMFLMLKDSLTIYLENRVENEVMALGEEFVEGGIEYCEKLVKRNIAIRKIMGSYGEKVYTAGGNDSTLIRTPHIPLTYRLDLLRKYYKEVKDKESNL